MQTLMEVIKKAEKEGKAVGHFNVSTLDMLWAVVRGAEAVGVPVIVGVSEGEREFMGLGEVKALVDTARVKTKVPVFLNADHTYSFDKAKEVIDLGYDSLVIDGAKLPYEENIKLVKKCVDYAKEKGGYTVIEGELGYIGQSSQVWDEIPAGATSSDDQLTTGVQAARFINDTGVECFAPAVGSLHGMLSHGHNPNLNIERIREIKKAVKTPLVLHGGSGLTDDNFSKATEAGISVIHVSTELRVVWKRAVMMSFQENQEELAAYKLLKPVTNAVQKVVEAKLKLFSGIK